MARIFEIILAISFFLFFNVLGIQVVSADEIKVLKEVKFTDFFNAKTKENRFEASGVVFVDHYFYIVFDSNTQVARVNHNLDQIKLLAGNNNRIGYEGITYHSLNSEFYLIEESIKHDGTYHARLSIRDNEIATETESAWLKFKFQMDNKGFEGVTYINKDNKTYILALCEGNACKAGKNGKKPGGGTIIVFEKKQSEWLYITSISLPKTLGFIDYSGIDINSENELAITSQESSAVWISKLNINEWTIAGDGKRYTFPKNKKGKTVYCNIEGISWVDRNKLVVVSDARKSSQPKKCKKKEQAIHLISVNNR